MSIEHRVAKLESSSQEGEVGYAFQNPNETEADAIARWHRERPGRNGAVLHVIRWLPVRGEHSQLGNR